MAKTTKVNVEALVEGLLLVVFGLLVAILRDNSLDIYFGIMLIATGVGLGGMAVVALSKTRTLPLMLTFGAITFLTLGICAFTEILSFGVIVVILFLALGALGLTLLLKGIELIVKRIVFTGVGALVVGALAIAASILYFTVTEFHTVLWITLGVLLVIYGAFAIIYSFTGKKMLEHK